MDEPTPYDVLFEIASRRGDGRLDLLEGKYLVLASKLRNKHLKRYGLLLGKLAGWSSLSLFKTGVTTRLGEGRSKRKEEVAEAEAQERMEQAIEDGKPIIEVGAPVKIARDFRAQVKPTLLFTDNEWLNYSLGAYHSEEDRAVRASVQQWLATGVDNKQGNEFNPTRRELDDIMDALRNLVFRSQTEAMPPAWLDPQEGDPDPKMILSCTNGLVNVLTGELLQHTPRFFTRNSVPYPYSDPVLTDLPRQWLAFLDSIWGDHPDNIPALQEIMGHLLTGETKYQKVFMLVGKPRAGKGVLARVITELLGHANVVSKSVNDMGTQFGKANLVGRQVMMVRDLRLGKGSNIGGITEFVLNVSGEDDVSISRKYKDDKEVRLNTRMFLISNAGMQLPDQSGALLQRLVPLVLHKSFADNPDVNLTDKLLSELPAILNWAIEGLKRLESRRDHNTGMLLGFRQTIEGQKMLTDIGRGASTVNAFMRECCVLDPEATVGKQALFDAFEGWCATLADIESVYTEATFTKELKVASGYVVEPTRRRTDDGGRERLYVGITLKPEFVDYAWDSETTEDF